MKLTAKATPAFVRNRRHRFVRDAGLAVALAAFFVPGLTGTQAASKEFSGGSNWLSSGNWTPSGVPATTDNIVVDSGSPTGGAYTITAGSITAEDINFSLSTTTSLSNTTSSSTASTLTLNGGRGSSTPLIEVNSTKTFTIKNGTTGRLGF